MTSARRANDFLAAQVAARPERFRGFAALSMQDPEAAAAELRCTVGEFGFVGALVNGFSELDDTDSGLFERRAASARAPRPTDRCSLG